MKTARADSTLANTLPAKLYPVTKMNIDLFCTGGFQEAFAYKQVTHIFSCCCLRRLLSCLEDEARDKKMMTTHYV